MITALVVLALAAAGVASASTFVGGYYHGPTKQKLGISFTATKTALKNVKYRARYKCAQPGGTPLVTVEATKVASIRVKNGVVNSQLKNQSGKDTAIFRGRLSGTTASGTLNETYVSRAGLPCRSGTVSWKAAH